MLLASSRKEFNWLQKVLKWKNFEEHGFRLSTGQLVAHRAKDFLRQRAGKDFFRVYYANDIISNSEKFYLRIKPLHHKKCYAVLDGVPNFDGRFKNKTCNQASSIQNWCNEFQKIIFIRRRSHKGDQRRFVGVYIEEKYLPRKYFLDNSLNFIVAENQKNNAPNLRAFYMILRSDIFERFFSVVSANTQINKNDMYLFGLPEVTESNKHLFAQLENLNINDTVNINKIASRLYNTF